MNLPGALFAPPPRETRAWAPRPNRHGHLTDAARDTAARLTQHLAQHRSPENDPRYPDEPDF